MQIRRTIVLAAVALSMTAGAHAQAPETKDVKLGVGGANALYYLPLALTDKLGHFKEQGLNVEINDFKGGSVSLNALALSQSGRSSTRVHRSVPAPRLRMEMDCSAIPRVKNVREGGVTDSWPSCEGTIMATSTTAVPASEVMVISPV